MLVIGIDPGTATTGYGLVYEDEAGDLNAVAYGVIQTHPDLDMAERLLTLNQDLLKLLQLHRPDQGAVEKLFFQRNTRTAISVGQGRGVVLMTLAQASVPVFEYTPLEVKQAITGYGKAAKHQIQQMISVLLNLDDVPKPDDAADALAVAVCHLNSARMKAVTNQE